MEAELLKFLGEGSLGAAALYMLWRLAERVQHVAEGFATCSAKLDVLINILKRDHT